MLLTAGIIIFFTVLPAFVEHQKNTVTGIGLYSIETKAQELHKNLNIVDLHADSLLWGRDLTLKSKRGLVDFPRMREGNLGLQVFSAVTETPRGLNIHRNKNDTDNILFLALAQRWPISTYFSIVERALYLADRLHRMSDSDDRFEIITDRDQLENFLRRRDTKPELIGGLLALEGAQALEGKLENLQKLSAAGYRMISPAHFFDTEVGGSAHGWDKGGLTGFGRQWVREMDRMCMIIDLAHASGKVIDEVLALTTRPVVVSHTGAKGACNNNRNLSDTQLKKIAANDGLIGIGFWSTATCGDGPADIARAIKYTASVTGVEHVALGSDFDGAVALPFDASDMIQITQALISEGFDSDQITAIMGDNALRFLSQSLGDRSCYFDDGKGSLREESYSWISMQQLMAALINQ